MKTIHFIFYFFLLQCAYAQELDIFQDDSIYAMNKISVRTIYSMQGKTKQKELVTYYNSQGQKKKQYWFWNGDEQFHNVETFIYLENGKLRYLVDSFANGDIEKTNFIYLNNILMWDVTLNQQNDTCDFHVYPDKNMTVQHWYMKGRPYRVDTTVFEKQNAKLEYYGAGYSDNIRWHYKFSNHFDVNGNLISVENHDISFTSYLYDKKNLLIEKQEQMRFSGKQSIKTVYIFEYQ
jgi:hypothetical protein